MAKTPSNPRPRVSGGGRQTQAGGFNPYAGSGVGIIPRRGVTHAQDLTTYSGVKRVYNQSPLRLLSLLADIHPSIGLALWNVLRLTCGEGDLTVIAVKDATVGADSIDASGTAAIEALWESLPSELAGLVGLQSQLTIQAMLTGLVCLEAVPGGRLRGVGEVWPVDSLTIGFHRDPATRRLVPGQKQIAPVGPMFSGFVTLSTDTFFWRSIDAMVDEPYGRAPFAPAISEVLADLAMMQDLRDAVHNSAWPRKGIGFNFAEMYKVATEVMGINDSVLAAEWVQKRYQEVVDAMGTLNPDDDIVYDSNGKIEVLEGGKGLASIEPILTYLRQRIVQALKTLPTLMGINDGSTQTYTTVEWAIYAKGLESIRSIVAGILVQAAQLHLRLLGLNLKAIAKTEPIRTTDGFIEAQAEQLTIANWITKIKMGWSDNDEAAVAVTGSKAVGEPVAGMLEPVAPAELPPQDINKGNPTPKGPTKRAA